MRTYQMLVEGDLEGMQNQTQNPALQNFAHQYLSNNKSIQKARLLNAVLPGSGYYYVGQKQSALTSFLLNVLFSTAAYQFFDNGQYAAGIIMSSF